MRIKADHKRSMRIDAKWEQNNQRSEAGRAVFRRIYLSVDGRTGGDRPVDRLMCRNHQSKQSQRALRNHRDPPEDRAATHSDGIDVMGHGGFGQVG